MRDVGQCPDMGGYKLGCKDSEDFVQEGPRCNYVNNNLGII